MHNVTPEALAIIGGYHADPSRYLGSHFEHGTHVVCAFLPGARAVSVRFKDDQEAELKRIHGAGLFVGPVPSGARDYRLKVRWHEPHWIIRGRHAGLGRGYRRDFLRDAASTVRSSR